MQQHYQVINLHNIIRSQQAKILQLREQLSIANERQQVRYKQFTQNNKIAIQEKDKMIDFLKEELTKLQANRNVESYSLVEKSEKQREKVEKQLVQYKKKCIQLQGKYKRLQSQSQTQLQSLKSENQTLSSKLQSQKQLQTVVTLQITKLNHFYKNSLFQLGKRKQTLLWVDKFTQYLETSENKDKRTLEDVSNFVKNQVNGLKGEIGALVTQILKNQGQIMNNKAEVNNQLGKAINKLKQECNKIGAQNEQFWNNIIKMQKQQQKKQQIKSLQGQLASLTASTSSQLQQYKALIKSLQNEKKTLILGFQQLRSLTQHRQVIHKEEVHQLKKTISDLIQSSTQRDKEFQREIKQMTRQIQSMSERYYQNIENPVKRANVKMAEQMEYVRNSLSRIQADEGLKNSIQGLERKINTYIEKTEREGVAPEIKQYVLQSNQMLQELLAQFNNFNGREGYASKENTSRAGTFQKEFQQIVEEQRIVLRQKYNKSQYEVTLAKKHLTKLKQYYQNLQKRQSSPSPSRSTRKPPKQPALPSSTLTKKLLQLQAQNQSLKQSLSQQQCSHTQQLSSLRKRYEIKSTSQQVMQNSHSLFRNSLAQFSQINQEIIQYLREQRKIMNQMRENLRNFRSAILQPMESFQMLMKEVGDGGFLSFSHNINTAHNQSNSQQNTDRQQITARTLTSRIYASEQIKTYKQILLKKSDNNSTITKLLTELIKSIRQSNVKQLKQKLSATSKQDPHHVNNNSGNVNVNVNRKMESRLKGIEKKIKDIQAQKVKMYGELVEKIGGIQHNVDKLGSKIAKSQSIKANLNKFEANLDCKINEIVSKTQIKLDRNQQLALRDQVIGDLRAKLQQANTQSEGLRRQMMVLYAEKKGTNFTNVS